MRVAPPTAAPAPQQSASALPTVPPAHAMATEKPADLRSYPRTTVPSLPNATLRAPVPVLPASFRLEAGTRLWIRLTSLSRQPDGNVQFAGTLLEPVTQPGMPRLERGTAISGFEVQKQNVTSLVITTFNVGTVRYRLKGATATATIPASSSSKTLQFDKGQVLETFIDAPAIYEKASGNSQPQR